MGRVDGRDGGSGLDVELLNQKLESRVHGNERRLYRSSRRLGLNNQSRGSQHYRFSRNDGGPFQRD